MVPNQTQAEAQSHAIPPVVAAPFDNAPSSKIRIVQVADNFNELLTGTPVSSPLYRKKKPRSAATVRKYLISLSAVYQVGIKTLHVCIGNPVRLINKPPESEGRSRFLSHEERTALLRECKASESPDLYVSVLLALTTGMRWGEMRALQWQHIDLVRRWAVLLRTKNGDARGVPLTRDIVALLEQRKGQPNEFLFPIDVTKAWRNEMKRAGIKDFRWHDLRHSCGAMMIEHGKAIRDVAALLGHRNLQSTMRYTHAGNDHLQRIVEEAMEGVAV